jgi:hypothetical protein
MRIKRGIWSCITVGILLGVAVALQGWAALFFEPSQVTGKTLTSLLPAKAGTVPARDEPIAATEEMKKAVDELLNFNDGLYRIYQVGEARLSVSDVPATRSGAHARRLLARKWLAEGLGGGVAAKRVERRAKRRSIFTR